MQFMKIFKIRADVPVTSIYTQEIIKNKVQIEIIHRSNDNIIIPIEALVVPKIKGVFPDQHLGPAVMESCQLADPSYNQPESVQLLLGIGVWAQILLSKIQRFAASPFVIGQETKFGYVIFGQLGSSGRGARSFMYHVATKQQEEDSKLDQMLLKYWNADKIPLQRVRTPEEERAELNFITTHRRDENGRFIVTIPRKIHYPALANSFNIAKACFMNVEKKMQRYPELKAKYKEVFADYLQSGHMIEVAPIYDNLDQAYYLPHHPINYDPAKAKGKFRVVFNASAPSSNGVSFNDQQLKGPKLQSDLVEIFMRFRLWRFAMTADIKAMFRQVRVDESEYNFQRILYREEPHLPLKQYAITVVSWGMTSAGFNAVRALRQCAVDGTENYPTAASIVLNDFYFDDLLTGAHSQMELAKRQKEVSDLLQTGGFDLTKYCSNSDVLSTQINSSGCEVPLECGVLGLKWDTKEDALCLNTSKYVSISDKITKRKVLSAISKIYDPSGLILPVIVTGKIIQQKLWKAGLDWDDELTPSLRQEWLSYENSIFDLKGIKIQRWTGVCEGDSLELHVFSDASESAKGTCVYLVSRRGQTVTANLITSRSQVAPIKKVTLPRLELSAAEIGAQLAKFVIAALRLENVPVFYWSDSTITLHWINKNPLTLTEYVANKVSSILEISNPTQWRHVPGVCNPADLLTRGATAQEIKQSSLWWHGPEFLQKQMDQWPSPSLGVFDGIDPEHDKPAPAATNLKYKSKRGKVVSLFTKPDIPTITSPVVDGAPVSLINKFSDLFTLLRVTAYVQRFVKLMKSKVKRSKVINDVKAIPRVTVSEQKDALRFWVSHTQKLFYSKEIGLVAKGESVGKGSSIVKLTPWLDDRGLLRVAGRLKFSNLSFDSKHQLIIPPQSRLAHLLVVQMHQLTMHGGPQLLMAQLRKFFWMNRFRQICKSVIHRCVSCIRFAQKPPEQLMGHLPKERVTVGEPFARTGVDFAGPFNVKRSAGRPTRSAAEVLEKVWVAIFVCLITRAVHVEVLFGLAVPEFLAAFERFVTRKGRCFHLKSDNGTTFIGTDNELARVLEEWSKCFPTESLAKFNTRWDFITPAAPHKGGVWEAAVKKFKHYLKRKLRGRTLCGKSFAQIAIQIEGIINSSPLWPSSDDPSDLKVITPADLVLGKPIINQPLAEYVADEPSNRLTWWQERQKINQELWQAWNDCYLTTLQERQKWNEIEQNIAVGQMVLIREENLPPTQWRPHN